MSYDVLRARDPGITKGSKGIRQCPIMYIPINDTQNLPVCILKLVVVKRLNTQLNEPNNQNSLKSLRLLS